MHALVALPGAGACVTIARFVDCRRLQVRKERHAGLSESSTRRTADQGIATLPPPATCTSPVAVLPTRPDRRQMREPSRRSTSAGGRTSSAAACATTIAKQLAARQRPLLALELERQFVRRSAETISPAMLSILPLDLEEDAVEHRRAERRVPCRTRDWPWPARSGSRGRRRSAATSGSPHGPRDLALVVGHRDRRASHEAAAAQLDDDRRLLGCSCAGRPAASIRRRSSSAEASRQSLAGQLAAAIDSDGGAAAACPSSRVSLMPAAWRDFERLARCETATCDTQALPISKTKASRGMTHGD